MIQKLFSIFKHGWSGANPAKPRYDATAPIDFKMDEASFGRAQVYGEFRVFDADLPGDTVARGFGYEDLEFAWSEVEEFIEDSEGHRHLDAEQRAVAIVYFSCVGTDRFPIDILIDQKKITQLAPNPHEVTP